MALTCYPRRRSLEDLFSAKQKGCDVLVNRGAREALVETMKTITRAQMQCTTNEGEEFCLCERTVSNGSVGVKIYTPFDKLSLGDLVEITIDEKIYEDCVIYKFEKEAVWCFSKEKKIKIRKQALDKRQIEIYMHQKNAQKESVTRWSELATGIVIHIEGKGPLWIDSIIGNKLCCQKPDGMFDYTSIYGLLSGEWSWR